MRTAIAMHALAQHRNGAMEEIVVHGAILAHFVRARIVWRSRLQAMDGLARVLN